MKQIALLTTALLFATPLAAEDEPRPWPDLGFPLPEALGDALEGFAETLAPELEKLGETLDDLGNYEAPEVLPNGDIIIRRKTPLDPGDAVEI